MPTTDRVQGNVDPLLHGRSRPVLAVVAFFAAFLFTALPFAIGADTFLVAAPFIVASFSSTVLFLRLLIGETRVVEWILLGTAAYLAVFVVPQWYIIVVLTGGTVLCLFLINRLIGNFVPLVDIWKHQRV